MLRAAVVICSMLVLAGCGGGHRARRESEPRATVATVRLPAGSRILRHLQEAPSGAYLAGGGLYLIQTSPAGEHTGELYELTRIDATSGRLTAVRRFSTAVSDVLLADRSLWLTTTAGHRTWLWRLDPGTLTVRARRLLAGGPFAHGSAGSLAVAGGHLWVGTGLLDRISLSTGRVDRVAAPPARGPVQLAADPAGRVLVASVGFGDSSRVVRLDPSSGAVLARSEALPSASQQTPVAVLDGGVWIERSAGGSTRAVRLALAALRPTRTSAPKLAASRIGLLLGGRSLWVIEPDRSSNLDYCADPVTGTPLAELPPLPGDSTLLAASSSSIFFDEVPVNAHSVALERAPVSPACGA